MIKLNLLPEEYQRKKTDFAELFKKYKTFAIPGTIILLASIVIIAVFVTILPRLERGTLRRLEKRWGKIEKDYEEVLNLKKDKNKYEEIIGNIKKITKSRILWAEKLNIISDSLPGEVQLTEIVTKVEKTKDKPDRMLLMIQGQVPFSPGERAIGEFVKGLSTNVNFKKDFPQIEPPSTQSGMAGFKLFTIKCYMPEVKKEEKPIEEKKNKNETKPKRK